MKQRLLLQFFFFCSTLFWSQVKYEKGYFIDNEDHKHEVLIKNIDWLENPNSFKYKTEENSEEKTATTKDVKEFQVYGFKKLVRYDGETNISSNDIQNLSASPEPEITQASTFLYLLSTGKKNLYSLNQNGVQNYFYSKNNGEIQLLVFKKYYLNGNHSLVAKNNTYREQLSEIFSDDDATKKSVDYTDYTEYSLLEIFNQYNNVTNKSTVSKEKGKSGLHFSLKSGINFSRYEISPNSSAEMFDANLSAITPRFSTEFEYTLPFNKNKWSFLVEIAYSTMNSETRSTDNNRNLTMRYSSIEFPIGVKYNMFINDNSKVFIHFRIPVLHIKPKESYLKYSASSSETIISIDSMNSNRILGFGYTYKNIGFVEFNAALKKPLTNYSYNKDSFSYYNISLGYIIF